ncbi:peptidase [Nissabacter sp. SGAir0207]|uniref:peptidase n=1 Tax=Nissabacter sp. SGAir0207 TaxID=2126321 RepID=UPI0010CCB43F|nr:peptidase [Nissabacter sp. SGAir0207]QCR38812.1 peptidase [Nissabacter sp. SGAir0207]
MGFPSPAQDYARPRLSLDAIARVSIPATYFMRAADYLPSVGILKGSVLVIDRSLDPKHGSLLIAWLGGEFKVVRYVSVPEPALQRLTKEHDVIKLSDYAVSGGDDSPIWGVIAYVLSDVSGRVFNQAPGI